MPALPHCHHRSPAGSLSPRLGPWLSSFMEGRALPPGIHLKEKEGQQGDQVCPTQDKALERPEGGPGLARRLCGIRSLNPPVVPLKSGGWQDATHKPSPSPKSKESFSYRGNSV